jgi:hypothetical protein
VLSYRERCGAKSREAIVKRCDRLGCEIVFPERAATGGRLRRFCSHYCRSTHHRRNRPRPALLPPLPPPVGWYPRSATPPAWPPTPTLTRSEAAERWAEMVFAHKSAVAKTRRPVWEDDLEPRVPPPIVGESTQRHPIGAPTPATHNEKDEDNE